MYIIREITLASTEIPKWAKLCYKIKAISILQLHTFEAIFLYVPTQL